VQKFNHGCIFEKEVAKIFVLQQIMDEHIVGIISEEIER
jgi:hypothetical protein